MDYSKFKIEERSKLSTIASLVNAMKDVNMLFCMSLSG